MIDVKKVRLTRILLVSLLTTLGITAALGVIVLLGVEFGEMTWRILSFGLSTAYFCLTGLGCAVALERAVWQRFAKMGIALSTIAFLVTAVGIFTDFFDSEEFGKSCGILWMLSAVFGYSCLMTLPRLSSKHAWMRITVIAMAFVLTAIFSYMLITELRGLDEEFFFRVAGVLSVLIALGTLGIPVVSKLSALPATTQSSPEKPEEIQLSCPRCHKRQLLLFGGALCERCGLEIDVQIKGWEETDGSTGGHSTLAPTETHAN